MPVFKKLSVKSTFNVVITLCLVFSLGFVSFILSLPSKTYAAYVTGKYGTYQNKIVDPNGNVFIVKGLSAFYSTFRPEDGDDGCYGDAQYNIPFGASQYRYQRDIDQYVADGFNEIRIFVNKSIYSGNPSNPDVYASDPNLADPGANAIPTPDFNCVDSGPDQDIGTPADNVPFDNTISYLKKLDNVIRYARSKGLVVEIANSYSDPDDAENLAFLSYLADKYKNDAESLSSPGTFLNQDGVWLQPMNEPRCAHNYVLANCDDFTSAWTLWRNDHNSMISTIRGTGFNAPLVINTIEYSWNLRDIGLYSLTDSADKLIYATHRYSDTTHVWNNTDVSDANAKWANLSLPANLNVPVIADEIGNDNDANNDAGRASNNYSWLVGTNDTNADGLGDGTTDLDGMLTFTTNWINTRCGSGAVAYTSFWGDLNSMYGGYSGPEFGGSGSSPQDPYEINNGVRRTWGDLFVNRVVNQAVGSPSSTCGALPATTTPPVTTTVATTTVTTTVATTTVAPTTTTVPVTTTVAPTTTTVPVTTTVSSTTTVIPTTTAATTTVIPTTTAVVTTTPIPLVLRVNNTAVTPNTTYTVNSQNFTLSGTGAPANSTVIVNINGVNYYTVANASGNWMFPYSSGQIHTGANPVQITYTNGVVLGLTINFVAVLPDTGQETLSSIVVGSLILILLIPIMFSRKIYIAYKDKNRRETKMRFDGKSYVRLTDDDSTYY